MAVAVFSQSIPKNSSKSEVKQSRLTRGYHLVKLPVATLRLKTSSGLKIYFSCTCILKRKKAIQTAIWQCRKLRLVGLIASMTRLGTQSTTVVSVEILSCITRSQLFTFKKLNPLWWIMHQNEANLPPKRPLSIGNILYKMSFTVAMPPA